MMRLAGHHVGLDSLEVTDGQVVGGVRVTLVGAHFGSLPSELSN